MQRAELAACLLDHGLHVRGRRNIHHPGFRAAAGLFNLLRHRLGPRAVEVCNHHCGTPAGQLARNGRPDTRGGAGHQGNPVGKIVRHEDLQFRLKLPPGRSHDFDWGQLRFVAARVCAASAPPIRAGRHGCAETRRRGAGWNHTR